MESTDLISRFADSFDLILPMIATVLLVIANGIKSTGLVVFLKRCLYNCLARVSVATCVPYKELSVTVNVAGNGIGPLSSNPSRGRLPFTSR